MLKITVSLLPFGDETKEQIIGIGKIANVSNYKTDNHLLGDYKSTFYTRGQKVYESHIKNHNRGESVWRLVKKVLEYFEEDIDRFDVPVNNFEKDLIEYLSKIQDLDKKE